MVKLSNEHEIVECKGITRKCILLEYKNSMIDEKMIMPCENLEECDWNKLNFIISKVMIIILLLNYLNLKKKFH